jgi:pimeloyl-ACP methyl ester carboxylesterase
MTTAPIILVPGFWLGAWAWDEVADALRADGHDVTALTLPGLESADADRSAITMSDHVDAVYEAVRAADAPVVLAVHSGTGFAGYAASDSVPERIAAMVYVDSAPGIGAMDPDFEGVEMPCRQRRSSPRRRTSTDSPRSSSRHFASGRFRNQVASCARGPS